MRVFPCPEDDFNCLFCCCPLYAQGKKCGGRCTSPHWPQHYEKVLARYEDIMEVVKHMDGENE